MIQNLQEYEEAADLSAAFLRKLKQGDGTPCF